MDSGSMGPSSRQTPKAPSRERPTSPTAASSSSVGLRPRPVAQVRRSSRAAIQPSTALKRASSSVSFKNRVSISSTAESAANR